jgi:hypothetical protein
MQLRHAGLDLRNELDRRGTGADDGNSLAIQIDILRPIG